MCDAGCALAIMGNHEYNAICFHTPHTERERFFRSHDVKEVAQHIKTLEQFEQFPSEWDYFLEWFKSLPIFLELPELNVVHAYWKQENIDWIKQHYHGMNTEFLTASCDATDNTGAYTAIEETLKGIETDLPVGVSMMDKDGHERTRCRIKWWTPLADRICYQDMLIPCPDSLKEKWLPEGLRFPSYTDDKPVFFGHYAINSYPLIENEMAVCLDFNVVHGKVLVACRLEGDKKQLIY